MMYKFTAALVLVYALAIPCSEAAPAPFPRATRPVKFCPEHLFGSWTMTWHGSEWSASFGPCGAYSCWRDDARFYGSWKLEGDRLVIREARDPSDDQSYTEYVIRFDPRTLTGAFGTDQSSEAFRLQRR